jgi:hypothetical protein
MKEIKIALMIRIDRKKKRLKILSGFMTFFGIVGLVFIEMKITVIIVVIIIMIR